MVRREPGRGRVRRDVVHANRASLAEHQSEDAETDETSEDHILLAGKPAGEAVSAFIAGKADMVLGGTFADLPIARQVRSPRNALRFDPASGLFGLAPGGRSGRFATV